MEAAIYFRRKSRILLLPFAFLELLPFFPTPGTDELPTLTWLISSDANSLALLFVPEVKKTSSGGGGKDSFEISASPGLQMGVPLLPLTAACLPEPDA